MILYVIGGAGRDRDRGHDDQQRRELLLLRHRRAPDRGRSRARLFAAATLAGVVSRRRHGIHTDNLVVVARQARVLRRRRSSAPSSGRTSERGFPLAFLLVIIFLVFWTWVAERTTFGRHVYAVGGNAEAARRAGINVPRIRVLVFMISGLMAGFGGVIFAARLNSVDLERRRRHAPARRDLGGGDRRHEPVRRSRPRDQRAAGRARDLDRRRTASTCSATAPRSSTWSPA